MVLHARAVLDLYESREQEIRFEQVEGDFDSLEGKWIFEQLGSHHTLLKYTVESKMRKDTFLSEAIMEEVWLTIGYIVLSLFLMKLQCFFLNFSGYLRRSSIKFMRYPGLHREKSRAVFRVM